MIQNNQEYQAAIKRMNELLAIEIVKELDALALEIETYEELNSELSPAHTQGF